jgi:hypothetical protein
MLFVPLVYDEMIQFQKVKQKSLETPFSSHFRGQPFFKTPKHSNPAEPARPGTNQANGNISSQLLMSSQLLHLQEEYDFILNNEENSFLFNFNYLNWVQLDYNDVYTITHESFIHSLISIFMLHGTNSVQLLFPILQQFMNFSSPLPTQFAPIVPKFRPQLKGTPSVYVTIENSHEPSPNSTPDINNTSLMTNSSTINPLLDPSINDNNPNNLINLNVKSNFVDSSSLQSLLSPNSSFKSPQQSQKTSNNPSQQDPAALLNVDYSAALTHLPKLTSFTPICSGDFQHHPSLLQIPNVPYSSTKPVLQPNLAQFVASGGDKSFLNNQSNNYSINNNNSTNNNLFANNNIQNQQQQQPKFNQTDQIKQQLQQFAQVAKDFEINSQHQQSNQNLEQFNINQFKLLQSDKDWLNDKLCYSVVHDILNIKTDNDEDQTVHNDQLNQSQSNQQPQQQRVKSFYEFLKTMETGHKFAIKSSSSTTQLTTTSRANQQFDSFNTLFQNYHNVSSTANPFHNTSQSNQQQSSFHQFYHVLQQIDTNIQSNDLFPTLFPHYPIYNYHKLITSYKQVKEKIINKQQTGFDKGDNENDQNNDSTIDININELTNDPLINTSTQQHVNHKRTTSISTFSSSSSSSLTNTESASTPSQQSSLHQPNLTHKHSKKANPNQPPNNPNTHAIKHLANNTVEFDLDLYEYPQQPAPIIPRGLLAHFLALVPSSNPFYLTHQDDFEFLLTFASHKCEKLFSTQSSTKQTKLTTMSSTITSTSEQTQSSQPAITTRSNSSLVDSDTNSKSQQATLHHVLLPLNIPKIAHVQYSETYFYSSPIIPRASLDFNYLITGTVISHMLAMSILQRLPSYILIGLLESVDFSQHVDYYLESKYFLNSTSLYSLQQQLQLTLGTFIQPAFDTVVNQLNINPNHKVKQTHSMNNFTPNVKNMNVNTSIPQYNTNSTNNNHSQQQRQQINQNMNVSNCNSFSSIQSINNTLNSSFGGSDYNTLPSTVINTQNNSQMLNSIQTTSTSTQPLKFKIDQPCLIEEIPLSKFKLVHLLQHPQFYQRKLFEPFNPNQPSLSSSPSTCEQQQTIKDQQPLNQSTLRHSTSELSLPQKLPTEQSTLFAPLLPKSHILIPSQVDNDHTDQKEDNHHQSNNSKNHHARTNVNTSPLLFGSSVNPQSPIIPPPVVNLNQNQFKSQKSIDYIDDEKSSNHSPFTNNNVITTGITQQQSSNNTHTNNNNNNSFVTANNNHTTRSISNNTSQFATPLLFPSHSSDQFLSTSLPTDNSQSLDPPPTRAQQDSSNQSSFNSSKSQQPSSQFYLNLDQPKINSVESIYKEIFGQSQVLSSTRINLIDCIIISDCQNHSPEFVQKFTQLLLTYQQQLKSKLYSHMTTENIPFVTTTMTTTTIPLFSNEATITGTNTRSNSPPTTFQNDLQL